MKTALIHLITILSLLVVSQAVLANAVAQRAILTTAIENREPVEVLPQQAAISAVDTTKLYFFTHITQGDGETIIHRWSLNGDIQAEVSLTIGSPSWRTYSSKRLASHQLGQWQVEAINEQGDVIARHQFVVQ